MERQYQVYKSYIPYLYELVPVPVVEYRDSEAHLLTMDDVTQWLHYDIRVTSLTSINSSPYQ